MTQAFSERFGGAPAVWARAPGRVDLMGSHTDYNLGRVLTMPIGRDVWIAARPRSDGTVRLYSMDLEDTTDFDTAKPVRDAQQKWGNYVRGVASVLMAEGFALTGFDGVLNGTVPMGSGLGSSAALECVVAVVFEALGGWELDSIRKALLCQKAEHQFVGVNCGILDQYTSCVGKAGCALLLDCRDLSSRAIRLAPGIQVVICDTKSKRELAGSEYGTRRAQCEAGARRLGVQALREATLEQLDNVNPPLPDEVARRCRFIVEEDQRVSELAEALGSGQREDIRRLCAGSYDGAMKLYEIGTPAMETMMGAMLAAPGVIGARQAGAGFGGCMVALVEQPAAEAFAQSVRQAYYQATGVQPEIYPVRAAAGAGLLEA